MNQELIIELAMQAGFEEHQAKFDTRIERFAELIAAAERKIWADEFAGMGEWLCVDIIEGTLGETK